MEPLFNSSILTRISNRYYKTVVLFNLNNFFEALKIDEATDHIDIDELIETNVIDFDLIDIDKLIEAAAIAFDLIDIDGPIEININCEIRSGNNSFDYNPISINSQDTKRYLLSKQSCNPRRLYILSAGYMKLKYIPMGQNTFNS